MPILSMYTDTAGQVGVNPRRVKIVTTDDYDVVTSTGYLNGAVKQGFTIYATDILDIIYAYSQLTNTGTYGEFLPTVTTTNVTLSPVSNPGEVSLIGDATLDHVPVFADENGNIKDSTVIIDEGQMQNLGGDILAGVTGQEGGFVSVPAGVDRGNFQFRAVNNNTADVVSILRNGQVAQETTYTLPDPGGAAADVAVFANPTVIGNLVKAAGIAGQLVDGGKILTGTTPSYAGGGTSNAFTVTGLSATAVGSAVIRTSTNNVAIAKAVPGTNLLTITFTADPGTGTTVDYVYTTAPMT